MTKLSNFRSQIVRAILVTAVLTMLALAPMATPVHAAGECVSAGTSNCGG